MTNTVEVACPKCGARPGQPCITPSGINRIYYPHLARRKAFDAVREPKP